ncbi:MAG: hypothetical protein QXJ28_03420, partial [Candidatus Pacearchaeota archaeon]
MNNLNNFLIVVISVFTLFLINSYLSSALSINQSKPTFSKMELYQAYIYGSPIEPITKEKILFLNKHIEQPFTFDLFYFNNT